MNTECEQKVILHISLDERTRNLMCGKTIDDYPLDTHRYTSPSFFATKRNELAWCEMCKKCLIAWNKPERKIRHFAKFNEWSKGV